MSRRRLGIANLAVGHHQTVVSGSSSQARLLELLQRMDSPLSHSGGGLKNSRINLLRIVDEAGRHGIVQSDASAAMHMSAGAMSKICNDLEKIGLVARNSHPSDRRIKRIKLTDEGRKHLQTCGTALESVATKAFANLTRCEIEQLLALLMKASAPVTHKPCEACLIGGCHDR